MRATTRIRNGASTSRVAVQRWFARFAPLSPFSPFSPFAGFAGFVGFARFTGGVLGQVLVLGLAAGLLTVVPPAAAQASDSPVGVWQSIDDETGKPKALIRIADEGGVLSGRIEKILTDKTDAVCDLCEGALKDKPVLGMTILSGLKKGDEWYEGGTILDPAKGKVYKARLKTIDGGAKLEVRGFIGIALIGRSQTWLRQR